MSKDTELPQLISAAQHGDPAAIDQLLTTCQIRVRRYARKHCEASDVDDAVQETLLAISRKIKVLKAPAAFASWVFVIVKRECGKLYRAMFRHEPLTEDLAEQVLACRTDDDLRVDLIRALERLPQNYREVLLMRDFEGLTIAEICARLDEPDGAVKSRLHRAREALRQDLVGSS
ncbi:RNA polymerase sigma factor [Alcaligenaceae bacterium CGII-47]|nr:RNA polymerase sigma factor [Alcaligenaceae bacterium CGII-47]